jgi:hypothetical protein
VVVLLLNPIELVNMLLAADARGMNTSSYVWTSTEQFYSVRRLYRPLLRATALLFRPDRQMERVFFI